MFGDKTVTITTGSMNRLEPLRQALSTWLALPEVDEVIIVDWGSNPPLSAALRDFQDPRIVIVRATDQLHWKNAKCHNLELRLASRAGLWLRLDNDTLVRNDFFSRHPYKPSRFYAVNWRSVPQEVDDKRNLAGTLFASPRDVLRVNGYNERLSHYGREDDDLYARLTLHGYQWLEIDLATVEHIPHSDKVRLQNLEISPRILQEKATVEVWGVANTSEAKDKFIALSDKIVIEQPWTRLDKMTSWDTRQIDDRYWECKESVA